jgi:hypothetical protein
VGSREDDEPARKPRECNACAGLAYSGPMLRCSSLLAVALLSACGASKVQSQRLNDGSLSFRCDLPMDACVRLAQEQCSNQRFRILEGTSETRVRDAPPYEQSYHSSSLRLVCTMDGAEPLFSFGSASKSPAAAALPAAAAPRAPVCTQGQTRECVGAGACKGGQACLPDGTGFAACDCGPVVVAPAPEPSVSPASPSPSSSPVQPPPAP